MVAGFSPDQLRQFQATRGLFESGMGYDPTQALQGMAQEQFKPTIQPVTGFEAPTIEATQAPGAAQIGPVSAPQFRGLLSQDIGAYQSPYQQQVIDLAMGDIQRQADIARGGAQDRAIRAGAFGGSRSALLESESQRPYAEQMARTAAGLRQSGFEQAQAAAQSDLARQQQLGMFGAESTATTCITTSTTWSTSRYLWCRTRTTKTYATSTATATKTTRWLRHCW